MTHSAVHTSIVREVLSNSLPTEWPKSIGDQWSMEAGSYGEAGTLLEGDSSQGRVTHLQNEEGVDIVLP